MATLVVGASCAYTVPSPLGDDNCSYASPLSCLLGRKTADWHWLNVTGSEACLVYTGRTPAAGGGLWTLGVMALLLTGAPCWRLGIATPVTGAFSLLPCWLSCVFWLLLRLRPRPSLRPTWLRDDESSASVTLLRRWRTRTSRTMIAHATTAAPALEPPMSTSGTHKNTYWPVQVMVFTPCQH